MPRLGDLQPDTYFPVPQNPLMRTGGVGDLAPARFPIPQNPLIRQLAGGVGDLVPAKFPIPQNPLLAALTGGMSGCGCGSGCSGPNFYGMSGLGEFDLGTSLTSVTNWAKSPSIISAIPNWALYGGAALAASMFLGGGGGGRRRR